MLLLAVRVASWSFVLLLSVAVFTAWYSNLALDQRVMHLLAFVAAAAAARLTTLRPIHNRTLLGLTCMLSSMVCVLWLAADLNFPA